VEYHWHWHWAKSQHQQQVVVVAWQQGSNAKVACNGCLENETGSSVIFFSCPVSPHWDLSTIGQSFWILKRPVGWETKK